MKLVVYEFTAEDDNFGDRNEYRFDGYLLPSGEVLCPEEQTHDSFYEDLDSVQAHGTACVIGHARTTRTVNFTDDELREAIRGSAGEFGRSAIPKSLHKWLK